MLKEIRIPFLTIIFALASLFIFTKIFGPIPFSVNSITTTKQNLFTVAGEGEATAVPDTARVSLGVNKNASTVEAAQEQVNTIINQITNELKRLGVKEKDIKTSNYSVNPDYDFSNGRQTAKGYTVNATIDVEVKPIEKANQAIDVATKNGATQVGSVQFVLNDDDRSKLEETARKIAIDKAKQKAQSIANSAGIKLGRIIDVQENLGGRGYVPYGLDVAAKSSEQVENPVTELNPGENKVVVNVTLSYETF